MYASVSVCEWWYLVGYRCHSLVTVRATALASPCSASFADEVHKFEIRSELIALPKSFVLMCALPHSMYIYVSVCVCESMYLCICMCVSLAFSLDAQMRSQRLSHL